MCLRKVLRLGTATFIINMFYIFPNDGWDMKEDHVLRHMKYFLADIVWPSLILWVVNCICAKVQKSSKVVIIDCIFLRMYPSSVIVSKTKIVEVVGNEMSLNAIKAVSTSDGSHLVISCNRLSLSIFLDIPLYFNYIWPCPSLVKDWFGSSILVLSRFWIQYQSKTLRSSYLLARRKFDHKVFKLHCIYL